MSLSPPPALPQRRSHLDATAVTVLLLCCTLWGLNQVAAKVALQELGPLTQAMWRSAGAVLLVLLWSRWRGVPIWQRDGSLPGGVLAGLLFATEFACIFVGLQYTAASRMVVFLYTAPFIVALGMPFISGGERLGRVQWLGLLLAFAGVALAFSEGFSSSAAHPLQWWGDVLAVGGALTWGLTTLVIRASRLSRVSAEKTLAYQLGISALLFGLAWPFAGEAWPPTLSALTWASMGFQTVIVAFASFLTWFWLMRHYAAPRLSSFTLITPLAGLVFGVWLLGEPATWRLLVALVGVLAGLALINRK